MDNEEMVRAMKRIMENDALRLQLLAMAWAGYQASGIGAVVVETDADGPFLKQGGLKQGSFVMYFVPARDLGRFIGEGSALNAARKYCATYDPKRMAILVCFGPKDAGAAVAGLADPIYTPVSAYEAGRLPDFLTMDDPDAGASGPGPNE